MSILFQEENEIDLSEVIKNLAEYLYRMYQKPAILLLDENDVPLQDAYINGYFDQAKTFFRTLYRETLKDNSYLEKTIITGVSRVVKESIFAGANNFKVYTVLDNEFSTDFGITEQEMNNIIQDFQIEDKKDEIKRWYDGDKIGI